jgi:hypothetical protein
VLYAKTNGARRIRNRHVPETIEPGTPDDLSACSVAIVVLRDYTTRRR